MKISEFITKLRRFSGDFQTLTRDTWDGDGTATVFRTNNHPILEGSANVTVRVDGVVKTENADFTLDRDTGLLTFTDAPASGSDNITMDYYYFNLGDTEWLEIINNIIRDTKDDIWKDKVDEDTLNSVKDADEYDLDSISTDILAVIDVWAKKSAETEWKALPTLGINMFYHPERNVLVCRPSFSSSGFDLRIRYLEKYSEYSTTSDTFDIPTKYHNAIEYLCVAEYFDRLAAKKAQETAAKTKDITYTPAEVLIALARNYRNIGQEKLKKIKPIKPPVKIQYLQGGIIDG